MGCLFIPLSLFPSPLLAIVTNCCTKWSVSELIFSRQSQKSFYCHLVQAIRARALGRKWEEKIQLCFAFPLVHPAIERERAVLVSPVTAMLGTSICHICSVTLESLLISAAEMGGSLFLVFSRCSSSERFLSKHHTNIWEQDRHLSFCCVWHWAERMWDVLKPSLFISS